MSIKKKLKIGVIGSTGSVGITSLDIVSKYPKSFQVEFLVCDKNYQLILSQIKIFSPKYVFINNLHSYNYVISRVLNKKIIILNDYKKLQKISNLKFDKVILAIPGIEGLKFAFSFLKYSKELLIANKESIVCGGKVLKKKCQI